MHGMEYLNAARNSAIFVRPPVSPIILFVSLFIHCIHCSFITLLIAHDLHR